MIRNIKEKLKTSNSFKLRFFVIVLAVFCISTYSIGYAYFSYQLQTTGEIDILIEDSGLVITSISEATSIKSGTETSSPTYEDRTASFNVNLDKTNSQVVYYVTVLNDENTSAAFDGSTMTTTNDAITYTVEDVDRFTVLYPGESLTFKVTISYTEEYQYVYPTSKSGTLTINFLFDTTLRNKYQSLTGYIEEDTGDVTATSYGAPITIYIQNDNNFAIDFTLFGQNNFIIYNESGEEQTYTIGASQSITINGYIKDGDNANAIGTNPTVSVMAQVEKSGSYKDNLIDTIDLTLEDKAKYEILSDGYTETPTEVDYSQTDTSTGGIYSEVGLNGETTFYYRGKVDNNYFSFAGFTWRILRIDESSNIRLILNTLVTSNGSDATAQFKTSNSASTLEDAITLSKLIIDPSSTTDNSPLYGYLTDTSTTTLRGWYNNNIGNTSYADYVVDSIFCQDTTGGNATSSGTNSSVYYFGSYHKVGADTALYDPNFSCETEDQVVEKVGLITADEFVFAGGAFNVSNTTFFLNDSGISTNYWTMSPGYYDSSQAKVGVFFVYANGGIRDWPNVNTITNSFGIRPVITVDGSKTILGDGTSSNPYYFE